ncbi:hypothetical protein [Echinicola shivajiensis]|uniref:hypothetical protein n=1 Tax=Echinicola shivajiensis TaxID=1035916 RepID=UPI001BFBFE11|nr:hypothetical protein [Echinicola shivajiensis]
MKKYWIFVLLFIGVSKLAIGQSIQRDFFGDLEYVSRNGDFKAKLDRDVFKSLVYTDDNGNKVTFEKEYLDEIYGDILKTEEEERDFLLNLVRKYKREEGYVVKYTIDVFDRMVIEDNRENKLVEGKDVHGNYIREEKRNGRRIYVKKELDGGLLLEMDKEKASLRKNIFDKWVYQDSRGNKLEFSGATWKALNDRYGNNEEIFNFFTNELLYQN